MYTKCWFNKIHHRPWKTSTDRGRMSLVPLETSFKYLLILIIRTKRGLLSLSMVIKTMSPTTFAWCVDFLAGHLCFLTSTWQSTTPLQVGINKHATFLIDYFRTITPRTRRVVLTSLIISVSRFSTLLRSFGVHRRERPLGLLTSVLMAIAP